MKHKLQISLIILAIFLATQFIGLFVINQYTNFELPYGMQPPEQVNDAPSLISIIISFSIAIALIFILMKYKWKTVIRIWFFVVVILAVSISINALLKNYIIYSSIASAIIAIPLAYLKIFKPNVLSHNLTELLVYPGIAAVFVPILTVWSILVLLILISIYDMWMVWKTGLMQKMAKFQMKELKVFGGLMIPYLSKKVREKIKKLRLQSQKSKSKKSKKKEQKIKIQMAILGGGDIAWTMIPAGIFLRAFGLSHALFVIGGALAGLIFLFATGDHKKSYPAMPYITVGIFIAVALSFLIL